MMDMKEIVGAGLSDELLDDITKNGQERQKTMTRLANEVRAICGEYGLPCFCVFGGDTLGGVSTSLVVNANKFTIDGVLVSAEAFLEVTRKKRFKELTSPNPK